MMFSKIMEEFLIIKIPVIGELLVPYIKRLWLENMEYGCVEQAPSITPPQIYIYI